MVTFKAEVYAHQRKADGTWNIKIRVTHNQKKRYLATAWYVTKDDLTRSLKIKNQRYVDLTDQLIKQYRQRCDLIGEGIKSMSVDEVVDYIQHYEDKAWDLDIVKYARGWIERLQSDGREGNAATYQVAINSLVRFVGREQISVKEITVGLLTSWAGWIKKQERVTTGFAAHNYLSRLRAIHNRAKMEYNDEDAGIIRIPNSPFSHIEMPKQPVPEKRALSLEQLQAILDLPDQPTLYPNTNRFDFAWDLFALSFGLVGMNAADLWECTDYKGGRITYERKKTRNRRADRALISIKVEPEVKPLVDHYRDPTGERVFCFHKMYSSCETFSRAISKGLEKISSRVGMEHLDFYSARHTWATLALNVAGVDKWTVHTALNHVDDSTRVTDIYIQKSWEPIDEANRKVLNLVDYSNLLKQKSQDADNQ